MIPSRERLREAIGNEWESSGQIAERAKVNNRAAGQMLAALYRRSVAIERCLDPHTGNWQYRKAASS